MLPLHFSFGNEKHSCQEVEGALHLRSKRNFRVIRETGAPFEKKKLDIRASADKVRYLLSCCCCTEIYFSVLGFLRAQKHSVMFGEVSRQRQREKLG